VRGLYHRPAKTKILEIGSAGSNPAYSAKQWYFKSRPDVIWFIDLVTWKALKCHVYPGITIPDCNTVRAMNKISSIV
jgi:hypothetical protein